MTIGGQLERPQLAPAEAGRGRVYAGAEPGKAGPLCIRRSGANARRYAIASPVS